MALMPLNFVSSFSTAALKYKKQVKISSPVYSVKRWNDIIEGLQTFRQVSKNNNYTFISCEYVIPSTTAFPSHLQGIKLGRLLTQTRRAYQKGLLTSCQIETLGECQMHWDYETYYWNFRYLPALDVYKKLHGHLRVPIKPAFVIPSESQWPENLWGMKLGDQVRRWRSGKDALPLHIIKALEERDFIWDVNEDHFQSIVNALKTYNNLYGNLLVPQLFRIPDTAPWPKSTHGYALGKYIATLRIQRGMDTTKDEILDAIEFIWDPVRYRFEKIMLPACKIYAGQEKNDLNTMPKGFQVPKNSPLYPIECHGYRLGARLQKWRINGATRQDLLDEIMILGFQPQLAFSSSPQKVKILIKGLEWFTSTFEYKTRIKKSIFLPHNHPTLPGLPLGKLFHRAKKWDVKVGFSKQERNALSVFAPWNSIYQSTIFPLLEIYYILYGNLYIPESFTVPKEKNVWPKWSWKQKLGKQIPNIRCGRMSLSEEEKNKLESMLFKWGPKGRSPSKGQGGGGPFTS